MKEQLSLAELKNKAMSFDRAEMREVHIVKDGAETHVSKRHMGVWNVDKNDLACLSAKNYSVIQHKYVTEKLVEALTSLNIKGEASLSEEEHMIQIDIDFPDMKFALAQEGESYTTGIRVSNDYAKPAGLIISPKVTRLACANGMIVTDIVRPAKIKYTEELKVTVEGVIDKMLKDIINNDKKLQDMVSWAMEDSIEWQSAKLLIHALLRKKKIAREILLLADKERDKETGRLNRWQMYNAITNFATQGQRLGPKIEDWLQTKAQQVFRTPFEGLTEELITVKQKGD